MKPAHRLYQNRRGFTLIEIVGAIAVLGIAGLGLLSMLRENERNTRDRGHEFAAEQIVRNEIERLRIAGPWGGPASASFTVDETGARVPNGPYTVSISRTPLCSGSLFRRDTGYENAPYAGCPTQRVLATFTVTASFRVRGQTRSVHHTVSLGEGQTAPFVEGNRTSSAWNSATAP